MVWFPSIQQIGTMPGDQVPVWGRALAVLCGWALLAGAMLVPLPEAQAEWSPELKAQYLTQLDAVVAGATAVNTLVLWGRTRPAALPQVNSFAASTIDAMVLHLYGLKNVADIPGDPSGSGERPQFSCSTTTCNKDLEPPHPPRAEVLADAQTFLSQAVTKYNSANNILTALETSYGTSTLASTRSQFNLARNAATGFPWSMDWASEPRPVDGVLSAPGYTRDHAPAYYPQGSWANTGNGIAKSLYWYWQSWKNMLYAATNYCPTCLNNGAFQNRHAQGTKSGIAALGLLVGVETAHVARYLDWAMDPPNYPPLTTTRQQERVMMISELLGNIDPGGQLAVGTGGAPRGFNYDDRSMIETTTLEYTDRMICTGLVDGMKAYVGTSDNYLKWSLEAIRNVCDAHFHQANAMYRAIRAQYYPPLPRGDAVCAE